MSDIYWDPYDPEIDANPYAVWRRLRDEEPVYRNDHYDFYALSRYGDVERATLDPKTFSSAHGTVLEIMNENYVVTPMMIFMDPPDHTAMRRLVSKAFTPRRISTLEGSVHKMCAQLLDALADRRMFDFVQDFAARLPAMVIATLLGVPEADQNSVRELIDTTFHLDPERGMINDVSLGAQIELHSYVAAQLLDRTVHPKDDLLTDLVTAEVTDDDGVRRKLTPHESAAFGILLVSAGTETVARLLGWAAIVLEQHPVQRAELAANPSLVPNAIEELLRYEAPSPVQGRWTTRALRLYENVIPVDSKVLLLTASAGRDERAYANADRFDVHRKIDRHVSFGYGAHLCLGAALARLESRIALEEMLMRYPEWEVDQLNARRLHTSTVRGWVNIPVQV
jgi:cytochrome P450